MKIADHLNSLAEGKPSDSLESLDSAISEAAKAFSGSWFGYHSRIYYENLSPAPPGSKFDVCWGFMEKMSNETVGDWVEYPYDDVFEEIQKRSGVNNLPELRAVSLRVLEEFEESQSELLSIITPTADLNQADTFLSDLVKKIRTQKVPSLADFIEVLKPRGQFISHDMVAVQAGIQPPPHSALAAEVGRIRSVYAACQTLSKLARRAASHIENLQKRDEELSRVGTNVFIGHGRSNVWKDLREFIRERLRLPYDEFNRVPVAGFANTVRLKEMLDNAAFAFLVMTGEDEQADQRLHARLNVIHEAGLFQGRLGFEKAILLLEDGCEGFSNVQGIGYIPFPKGNISAAFEEIRRVLERAELIDSDQS